MLCDRPAEEVKYSHRAGLVWGLNNPSSFSTTHGIIPSIIAFRSSNDRSPKASALVQRTCCRSSIWNWIEDHRLCHLPFETETAAQRRAN
ncbi:hypothetical protein MJO28_010274 [Puccinia striiformis f. sp. tritici]|uniref:Uncharacterized protein n=1 Tax=Puccinia striiformis f. sp. tritici TaxID=168172 RepID=A0ACC0E419_9BASI|nr:hypothetical protein Pst134EA_019076 [Puccinia striiformis f. sp. tritici]KAH9458922.1 hypothetical protein Pst134EA_019076 [Puccinia striiformis f. sp. tritici]KAI7944579.1 hypothetical protein MJO28_010274 [Puccinia striiformis f. sp. tritici]KAI7948357.1 hypothetical protein MJO29_010022 [Puccinia striiformis f. sp. tritici]KAI9615490.1 hypothetical protein H4Q26_011431 [Puccinia striiformis f. sp. tritici PST-130]